MKNEQFKGKKCKRNQKISKPVTEERNLTQNIRPLRGNCKKESENRSRKHLNLEMKSGNIVIRTSSRFAKVTREGRNIENNKN